MGKMMHAVAVAALLIFGIAGSTVGLFEDAGDVIMLDSGNFKEVVMETKAIVLVYFFKPGHNENFAPEYAKVATNLKDIIHLGAVDCDAEPKLCQKAGIVHVPSFKAYVAGKTKNPYTGEVSRIPQDFQPSAVTASGIAKALKALLPTEHISQIASQADWDGFRAMDDGLPVVLLATTSSTTTPLYKSLALRFLGRMRFGEVRSTAAAELDDFPDVEVFPQLTVTLPSGQREVYEDQLQAAKLIEFLEGYAAPQADDGVQDDAKESGSDKAQENKASMHATEPLKLLKAADFDAAVLKDELPVLVAFLGGAAEAEDGNDCAEQEAQLQEAATGSAGMMPMFLVRVERGGEGEKVASSYSDDETTLSAALLAEPCKPKLALFPQGTELKADDGPEVFVGGAGDTVPSKKELQEFLYSAMPNRVARITSAIFQQYVATEIETIKVILLTEKSETPGMFRALAMNFPQFHFAEIHKSEKEAVSQFPNAKFPSVFLLLPGPPEQREQGGIQIAPVPGPYNFQVLSAILSNVLKQSTGDDRGDTGSADSTTASELVEVSTEQGFQDACVASGRLCVLAFLDNSKGGDALEKQIATIKSVMGKNAGAPLSFAWIDGKKQPEFAAALDVRSSDLPTVAVVSPQKRRYATLRGAFSEQYISALLAGIMSSKVKTHIVQELPKIVDGGLEDSGEDYEMIEEEEFDLADIMGEEVESVVTNEERLKEVEEELKREAAKAKEEEEAKKKADQASKKKPKSKKSKSKSKKSKSSKDEL